MNRTCESCAHFRASDEFEDVNYYSEEAESWGWCIAPVPTSACARDSRPAREVDRSEKAKNCECYMPTLS
jgi:hypothetical protein